MITPIAVRLVGRTAGDAPGATQHAGPDGGVQTIIDQVCNQSANHVAPLIYLLVVGMAKPPLFGCTLGRPHTLTHHAAGAAGRRHGRSRCTTALSITQSHSECIPMLMHVNCQDGWTGIALYSTAALLVLWQAYCKPRPHIPGTEGNADHQPWQASKLAATRGPFTPFALPQDIARHSR